MPGQTPPAIDFRLFVVETVPGQILVPFGFDARVRAELADARTGGTLYSTGEGGILLSEWVAAAATAADLAPTVDALLRAAVLRDAGVIE